MSDPNARARRARQAKPPSAASGRAAVAGAPAVVAGGAEVESIDGARSQGSSHAPEFEGQYRVELPTFEGPLDLLLHLIQQHELDILDIPVSFITEKYLGYLKLMQTLSIDVASEYLVMAATLTHMKSKMLLPSVPAGQEDDGLPGEEQDPRAELVRRLLEYQKYKAAAAELGERGTLGRDVFPRGAEEPVPDIPAPFASFGVFSLLDAFDKVLQRTKVKFDHEVVFDRVSITDRMLELTDQLNERKAMRFEEMFSTRGEAPTRFDLVITFLALLEMAKLRLIRVYQSDPLAPLHVELAAAEPGGISAEGFESRSAFPKPTSDGGGDPAPLHAVPEPPARPEEEAASETASDRDKMAEGLSEESLETASDGDELEALLAEESLEDELEALLSEESPETANDGDELEALLSAESLEIASDGDGLTEPLSEESPEAVRDGDELAELLTEKSPEAAIDGGEVIVDDQ